jgi:hypothetical protein
VISTLKAKSGMKGRVMRKRGGSKRTKATNPNRKRKYLIAGLAYGPVYGRGQVRGFIGTLRFAGYTGDIIMGVSPEQGAVGKGTPEGSVLDYYKMRNVTVKVVPPEDGLPLAFIRFYHYLKWLEPYDDDDLVLLSDTKDTFFQGGAL